MGHKDKVRAVGKTPTAETAQEMPADNERAVVAESGLPLWWVL